MQQILENIYNLVGINNPIYVAMYFFGSICIYSSVRNMKWMMNLIENLIINKKYDLEEKKIRILIFIIGILLVLYPLFLNSDFFIEPKLLYVFFAALGIIFVYAGIFDMKIIIVLMSLWRLQRYDLSYQCLRVLIIVVGCCICVLSIIGFVKGLG